MAYKQKWAKYCSTCTPFMSSQLLWSLGAAFLINLLSLALPLMMLQVYDRIIPFHSYSTLAWLTLGVLSALAFELFLTGARDTFLKSTHNEQNNEEDLFVLECILRTDTEQVRKTGTAKYLKTFSQISQRDDNPSNSVSAVLPDAVFILIFLSVLTALGGWLVAVPVTACAVMTIVVVKSKATLTNFESASQKSENETQKIIISSLHRLFDIRITGQHKSYKIQIENKQLTQGKEFFKRNVGKFFLESTLVTINQLSFIVLIFVGGIMVVDGKLSVGALSAATLLSTRAIQPALRLLNIWKGKALHSRSKIYHDLRSEMRPRAKSPLPAAKGNIALKNITLFGPMGKLLRDVSFSQLPCTSACINSRQNGSVSLLLRIIVGMKLPDDGAVLIDGFSPALRNLSCAENHISYLGDQRAIFTGTILENITGFSNEENRRESAIKYSKLFGLDVFVRKLPDGYHTQLNDVMADPLPPGMKQRVALIRAFSVPSSLLVLDRTEYDLDADGCEKLCAILSSEKHKRTITLSTENPSIATVADTFYRLQEGQLVRADKNLKISIRQSA